MTDDEWYNRDTANGRPWPPPWHAAPAPAQAMRAWLNETLYGPHDNPSERHLKTCGHCADNTALTTRRNLDVERATERAQTRAIAEGGTQSELPGVDSWAAGKLQDILSARLRAEGGH